MSKSKHCHQKTYCVNLIHTVICKITSQALNDKTIIDSYNEDSILIDNVSTNGLWVLKLTGEATQINIDAKEPYRACAVGKTLFVYCRQKKAIIAYV